MILIQREYNRCMCLVIIGSHCEVNPMHALVVPALAFPAKCLEDLHKT